jgi:hypothetical protein
MRNILRSLPAAAALAMALPAFAQVPSLGIVTDDCTTPIDNSAGPATDNAVLISVKVSGSGSYTDMLFDLRAEGGLQAGGADRGGTLWNVPPNWRLTQGPADTQVVILIYPPAAAGQGYRVAIDSDLFSNQDQGINARQIIGNSIPVSYAAAGLAPIGLVLPGTSATYGVKLKGAAPAATANFPQIAGAGGALQGIEVAFSPLIEVNNVDWTGNACSVAGSLANQATTSPAGNDGAIIGYNVYRLAGTAAAPPTANAFYTASLNNDPTDGWQYFIPMTSTLNLTMADNTGLVVPTPPAGGDSAPNDLGGMQNPDGVFGTGDEVMVFQDSAANRGQARASGSAPALGTSYWYAFQPVIGGSPSDFTAVGFGSGGGTFNGNHTTGMDLSSLAVGADAVDLDLNGTPDFFSPQADKGQPGLGLMYNGNPAISAPVFADTTRPLPAAGGHVTLSGHIDGQNVAITFQSGLEAGTVKGFNVYRGVDSSAVRVNTQLILAQGSESSVYQLVDDAVQARRLSRGGSVPYSVEIVYQDGHTSTVGPFTVTLEHQAPGRRSR